MRILVVNGAPRRKGHTRDVVDLFTRGIVEAGGDADVVHLREKNIRPCQGCYHCWTGTAEMPECILRDDMPELIDRFYRADVLILATPIYFYTFSAYLKIFLERLLPVTQPDLELARTYGNMKNSVTDKERGPKAVGLIAVAGHRGKHIMNGILPTFDLIAEGLGAETVVKILREESFFLDFPQVEPAAFKRVQNAIRKAGREMVKSGRVSDKTQRETALPLTQDVEHYRHHFQTYWDIARETNLSGDPLRTKLKKAVRHDLRVLMPELAACFNPSASVAPETVLQFHLTDKQPGSWHMVLSATGCEMFPYAHENPTTTIRTTTDILISILMERKNPSRLAERGKLEVTGDLALFKRFHRLFPPPKKR